MRTQQDRQSDGNESEPPASNRTVAMTSRQVPHEVADNISHPGRVRLDELVPSRYALKVGKLDRSPQEIFTRELKRGLRSGVMGDRIIA